jgi:hypothetical protein
MKKNEKNVANIAELHTNNQKQVNPPKRRRWASTAHISV